MGVEIKIEKILDELLLLTSEEKYSDEIKKAHNIYMKGMPEGTIELGFNNWLILDYKFGNNSSFIKEYRKKNDLDDEALLILKALQNSTFSVFSVIETEKRRFLKDIFTKKDYKIINEEKIDRDPIISRLIKFEKHYVIVDIIEKWAESSEKGIQQAILKKYNEVYSKNKSLTIGNFIQKNSIVIYKYLMIYKDVEIKSVFEDEEYYVHQSKYKILDVDRFMSQIHEIGDFIFQTDEFENEIFELYDDNVLLAEIEVINNVFNVECRNKEDLDQSNLKLKTLLSDVVLKLKDEVLNIEDLISGR